MARHVEDNGVRETLSEFWVNMDAGKRKIIVRGDRSGNAMPFFALMYSQIIGSDFGWWHQITPWYTAEGWVNRYLLDYYRGRIDLRGATLSPKMRDRIFRDYPDLFAELARIEEEERGS